MKKLFLIIMFTVLTLSLFSCSGKTETSPDIFPLANADEALSWANINSNYGRFNSCFFMPPIIRGHFFCWSAACQSAYKRRGSFSEGCGDLGEHRP